MDTDRFDSLTRTFSTLLSRRVIASALGLGALALPGLADAKKKKRKKKKKKKCKGATKRCGKRCISTSACCANTECGSGGACVNGVCFCGSGFTLCHGTCIPEDDCCPNCEGRECGDDGCGGSCGDCSGTTTCQDGECVCAPQCAGKECGANGCGGSCGSCQGGVCQDDQCVNGTLPVNDPCDPELPRACSSGVCGCYNGACTCRDETCFPQGPADCFVGSFDQRRCCDGECSCSQSGNCSCSG